MDRKDFLKVVHGCRLVDPTQLVALKDYDSALKNYLNIIPLSKVKSIYQVGSIGIPGLSDIDLLVVMKDCRRDFWPRFSIRQLSDKDRYIFSHDCWFMDSIAFEALPLWFPYFDLVHVYGDKININEEKKNAQELNVILLINWLLTKVPSDFLIYSVLREQFHERVMLAMVNSLQHSVALWELSGQHVSGSAKQFVTEYNHFRRQWFDMPGKERREQLYVYVFDAVELSLDLIKSVAAYVRDHWIQNPRVVDCDKDWVLNSQTRTLYFSSKWDKNVAFKIALDSQGKKFLYPKELAIVLAGFKSSHGFIGRHVGENFVVNAEELVVESHVSSFLQLHVQALENYATFYVKKFGLPLPGYYTYWASFPRHSLSGLANRIINRAFSTIFHI